MIKCGEHECASVATYRCGCGTARCSQHIDTECNWTCMIQMQSMTEPRVFQCLDCGSLCASEEALAWHRDSKHPITSKAEPYTARANAVIEIVESLRDLSDSEIEIIAEVVRGVRAGRKEHGTLDLATDKRDFKREAWEEIRDLVFYLATIAVKEKGL